MSPRCSSSGSARSSGLLDGAPDPVPFGRTAADPVRVLTIERDRTLPPRELLDRIEATAERYARRLAELEPADLDRRGLHPRLGELTVAEILERFAVGHAEEPRRPAPGDARRGRGRTFDPGSADARS